MIIERKIKSPSDLVETLRLLKEAVKKGQLKQIWKPDAICGNNEKVEKIPDDGPWGDYLELYFVDPKSGAEYKLSVETYHGSGGALDRLP